MTVETLLVFTNLPSREAAEKMARDLVERRLAACVNLLAPCRSVYRWEGKVQVVEEHPILIKTTQDRYAALEEVMRASHPYEIPEIVAVPVVAGLSAYLEWVESETQPLH